MAGPSFHEESTRVKRRRLDAVDQDGTSSNGILLEALANTSDGAAVSGDPEAYSELYRQRLGAASNTSSAHAFPSNLQLMRLSRFQDADTRLNNDGLHAQAVARLQTGSSSRMPTSFYAALLNGHSRSSAGAAPAELPSLSSNASVNQVGTPVLLERAPVVRGGTQTSNINTIVGQRGDARASNAMQRLLEDRQRLVEQQWLQVSEQNRLRNTYGTVIASSPEVSSILGRLHSERALLNHATTSASIVPGIHQLICSGRGTNGLTGNRGLSGLQYEGVQRSATKNSRNGDVCGARPTPTRRCLHLYMSCDDDDLSPYQCMVRKQIELFEAQEADAETNARGRNRPIVVGQVGIRCKHCKVLAPRKRARAAIYYPTKLDRLYQAGQTMASVHLGQYCQHIPNDIRQELAKLREGKSAALGGKKYWTDGAKALGVSEDDGRLWFR